MSTQLTIQCKVHFDRATKGRKEIREGDAPAAPPVGRVPRVARLLALAHRFEKLLREGAVKDYAELARLRIARLKAEAGDKDGASAAFRAAAAGARDADGRELAILLKAMQEFDSAKPEDLASELQPLLGKDRPWRPIALELLAAVALKQKDETKAKALLGELRDEAAASQALRERAAELLSALGEPAAK